jgi:hypothetical protein
MHLNASWSEHRGRLKQHRFSHEGSHATIRPNPERTNRTESLLFGTINCFATILPRADIRNSSRGSLFCDRASAHGIIDALAGHHGQQRLDTEDRGGWWGLGEPPNAFDQISYEARDWLHPGQHGAAGSPTISSYQGLGTPSVL